MTAHLYVEGGGDSKELHIRCREGFRRLLERCGFAGRMPRIVACGSRNAAYDDFRTAHASAAPRAYVALLVDSEDPVAGIDDPWGTCSAAMGGHGPRAPATSRRSSW